MILVVLATYSILGRPDGDIEHSRLIIFTITCGSCKLCPIATALVSTLCLGCHHLPVGDGPKPPKSPHLISTNTLDSVSNIYSETFQFIQLLAANVTTAHKSPALRCGRTIFCPPSRFILVRHQYRQQQSTNHLPDDPTIALALFVCVA